MPTLAVSATLWALSACSGYTNAPADAARVPDADGANRSDGKGPPSRGMLRSTLKHLTNDQLICSMAQAAEIDGLCLNTEFKEELSPNTADRGLDNLTVNLFVDHRRYSELLNMVQKAFDKKFSAANSVADLVAEMNCDGSDIVSCIDLHTSRIARSAFRRDLSDSERNQYKALTGKLANQSTSGVPLGADDYKSVLLGVYWAVFTSPHFTTMPLVVDDPGSSGEREMSADEVNSALNYLVCQKPDEKSDLTEEQARSPQARVDKLRRVMTNPDCLMKLADVFVNLFGIDRAAMQERALSEVSPALQDATHTDLVRTSQNGPLAAYQSLFAKEIADKGSLSVYDEFLLFIVKWILSDGDPMGIWNAVGLVAGVDGTTHGKAVGALGRPAFLLSHSYENPIKSLIFRGNFMAGLAGTKFPPPPMNVDGILPSEGDTSTMARIEFLMQNQPCSGCHVAINAYGLAFANYDHEGRYLPEAPQGVSADSLMNEYPVELYSTLDALAAKMASDPGRKKGLASLAVGMAVGRLDAPDDRAYIEWLTHSWVSSGRGFVGLLEALVASDEFAKVQY